MAVGGCGFQPGSAASSGGQTDATLASFDTALDTPPAPCPDADGDGVCDAVDDWPCGARPTAPATTVTLTKNAGQTNITLSAIAMVGGPQLVVATPGQALTFGLHYAITDTACASCVDQIEVGFVPGNRTGCVFDAAVSSTTGASGDVTGAMVDAPATAGTYDFRAHIGQNYSCNFGGATGWWGGTPPGAAATLVKLCVH